MHTYIFDLDSVLYPLGHPLEYHAALSIRRTVMRVLGWSEQNMTDFETLNPDRMKAGKLLRDDHGITYQILLGDYHNEVDYNLLTPCQRTQHFLRQLQGRKYVYTDGSLAHADKVLTRLGLTGEFDDIHDIHVFAEQKRLMDFSRYLHHIGANAACSTMLEDKAYNLIPVKHAGARTVLHTLEKIQHSHIDETMSATPDWLELEVNRQQSL